MMTGQLGTVPIGGRTREAKEETAPSLSLAPYQELVRGRPGRRGSLTSPARSTCWSFF